MSEIKVIKTIILYTVEKKWHFIVTLVTESSTMMWTFLCNIKKVKCPKRNISCFSHLSAWKGIESFEFFLLVPIHTFSVGFLFVAYCSNYSLMTFNFFTFLIFAYFSQIVFVNLHNISCSHLLHYLGFYVYCIVYIESWFIHFHYFVVFKRAWCDDRCSIGHWMFCCI